MTRRDSKACGARRVRDLSAGWRGACLALLMVAAGLAALVVAADDALQIGDHLFEFRGVTYNADGTSTWLFDVTSGHKPALSDWVLEWDPSVLGPSIVVSCFERYEVGSDPKTQVYGLKFDGGYRDEESRGALFTLDGWYEIASTRIGVKAGKDVEVSGFISGPGAKLEPENTPPTALDDAASMEENGSVQIEVLANDSDDDGTLNRTTLTITQAPAFGAATVNPTMGTVTYVPDAGACGSDAFSYTVEDDDGAVSNQAEVTVLISCNAAPEARDDHATTDEYTAVAVNIVANDIDEDGFLDPGCVLITQDPTYGSLSVHPATGVVTYTPAVGGCGDDVFAYTIDDDDGATSNPAFVTVAVLCIDPPLAIDDFYNIEEGGTLSVPAAGILANDQETPGKPLMAILVSDVKNGSLTLSDDGSFVYIHDGSETREDAFTYVASDTSKESNVATVNLAIAPTNDVPEAVPDEAETEEDRPVTVDVLLNDWDPDGDPLAVDWAGAPTHGTVSNLGTAITYSPNPDFKRTDTFTYAVSDGHGGTSSATVTVRVASVNDDPWAQADSASTIEDTAVTVAVLANDTDADGDPLTLDFVTQPENGSAEESGANVVYTPHADFHGTDRFTYTVSDGAGGTSSAVVTIVVAPQNDDPEARGGTVFTDEDVAVFIEVLANDSDPDGDVLTLESAGQPAHGTVTTVGTTATYTPEGDFFGEDAFTYTISDGHGGTATATITIVVSPVNDAPRADDDSAFTDEDLAVTVAVLENDSDPDGDGLFIEGVSSPAQGAAEVLGAAVVYTPAAGFDGVDRFTYTVVDGHGGNATATVTVNVATVNHPPVAVSGAVETDEDVAVTIAVLANDSDPDGDDLALQSVGSPSHGTLSREGTEVTYTPAAGFHGEDAFTYTVSDGRGGTSSATITVTVL
ncbi:MAG: Ig-like domain-containing protein, partial [Candidatus Bipolaricaulis sp.]|nr:Ig-like domain-containing protein [Candidatus Bipolaricaulis sp.]